jgi:hypothetical protein
VRKIHPTILVVDNDVNDRYLIQNAFKKIGVTDPIHLIGDGTGAGSVGQFSFFSPNLVGNFFSPNLVGNRAHVCVGIGSSSFSAGHLCTFELASFCKTAQFV